MTPKDAVATLIQRVCDGEKNPRDLDRIFSWLRFESNGAPAVSDVANFTAHKEERDRGFAYDGLKNLVKAWEIQLPLIAAQKINEPIMIKSKNDAHSLGIAILKAKRESDLITEFGCGRQQCLAILETVMGKISSIRDGSVIAHSGLTPLEERIFKNSTSSLFFGPSYSDEDLISQFADSAIDNGLAGEADRVAILAAKDFVALYALEQMQLAQVDVCGAPRKASLFVSRDKTLHMLVETAQTFKGLPLRLGLFIFTTKLQCDKWLVGSHEPCSILNPLEINGDCQLEPIC